MGYKFVEHTADIAVSIFAKTLEGLFLSAAESFKKILADNISNFNITSKNILLTSNSVENLLIEFLNELNYYYSAKRLIYYNYSLFTISKKNNNVDLQSIINFAYPTDDSKIKHEIKAVTYHNIKIIKTSKSFKTKIIFDI
jgi:SHS2 domain-containing protein